MILLRFNAQVLLDLEQTINLMKINYNTNLNHLFQTFCVGCVNTLSLIFLN